MLDRTHARAVVDFLRHICCDAQGKNANNTRSLLSFDLCAAPALVVRTDAVADMPQCTSRGKVAVVRSRGEGPL